MIIIVIQCGRFIYFVIIAVSVINNVLLQQHLFKCIVIDVVDISFSPGELCQYVTFYIPSYSSVYGNDRKMKSQVLTNTKMKVCSGNFKSSQELSIFIWLTIINTLYSGDCSFVVVELIVSSFTFKNLARNLFNVRMLSIRNQMFRHPSRYADRKLQFRLQGLGPVKSTAVRFRFLCLHLKNVSVKQPRYEYAA